MKLKVLEQILYFSKYRNFSAGNFLLTLSILNHKQKMLIVFQI